MHRAVYEITQCTSECKLDKVTVSDISNAKTSNCFDDSSHEDSSINQNHLVGIVERAYNFQKIELSDLISLCGTAGWDMSRFTFGSISNRIEIEYDGRD